MDTNIDVNMLNFLLRFLFCSLATFRALALMKTLGNFRAEKKVLSDKAVTSAAVMLKVVCH